MTDFVRPRGSELPYVLSFVVFVRAANWKLSSGDVLCCIEEVAYISRDGLFTGLSSFRRMTLCQLKVDDFASGGKSRTNQFCLSEQDLGNVKRL
jgi:hypothetical protein